jgi:hypothetical protein
VAGYGTVQPTGIIRKFKFDGARAHQDNDERRHDTPKNQGPMNSLVHKIIGPFYLGHTTIAVYIYDMRITGYRIIHNNDNT